MKIEKYSIGIGDRFGKEGVAQRNQYRAMSLAELKAAKLSGYGGSALTQADWAARLDHCDWEVLRRVQSDGLNMSQPELGPLKVLAVSLQVRFRIEVANGNWDDAVRTAKTMFALARHLGAKPAGASSGISTAEELKLAISAGGGHLECLMPAVMNLQASVSGAQMTGAGSDSFHGMATVTLLAGNPRLPPGKIGSAPFTATGSAARGAIGGRRCRVRQRLMSTRRSQARKLRVGS